MDFLNEIRAKLKRIENKIISVKEEILQCSNELNVTENYRRKVFLKSKLNALNAQLLLIETDIAKIMIAMTNSLGVWNIITNNLRYFVRTMCNKIFV